MGKFNVGSRPEAVGALLNRTRTEEEQTLLEYVLWLEERAWTADKHAAKLDELEREVRAIKGEVNAIERGT